MAQTKVNAIGFEILLPKNIAMSDLYKGLKAHSGKELKVGTVTHVPYADSKRGYITGLILTYRNHRKYMETTRGAAGLKVDKREIQPGANGTEACIFVINPDTKKGLLYTYYGALSPVKAAKIFKAIFLTVKKVLVDAHMQQAIAAHGGNATAKQKRDAHGAAAAYYAGKFNMKVLVTEEDLKTLLAKYKQIERLEVSAVQGLLDAPKLRPLSGLARSSHYGMTFPSDTAVGKIAKGILGAFGSSVDETLRIVGTSITNEDLSQCVGENRDDYEKVDYDLYVTELPDDYWSNYNNCKSMNRAIATMVRYRSTFGTPAKTTWP